MIDPKSFAPWVTAEARQQVLADLARSPAPHGDVAALRTFYDAYNEGLLAAAREAYPVTASADTIAGVPVHVVQPAGGPSTSSLLLCLHGGAFMWGRGAGALLEAVPVAATTGMTVIAVEYALAPENVFPAATDDVLAVYRALLERRPASAIGVFGCSAGGVLAAQATARLVVNDEPTPAAIAMLHGTGVELGGDSLAAAPSYEGQPEAPGITSLGGLPYLADADPGDPLVFPGEHPALLARFPPSLLVTTSRDFAAGAVTVMHRRLLAAGVDADLLMFDGLMHAHHMATTLPESRETFAALARFFRTHLRS